MKNVKILSFVLWVCSDIVIFAQIPRKTVVEHFTNTKCSVCASRNPGFNSNLSAHPQIIRLSIHPSAPYSACLLYTQNPSDNDARTNFYNVYGSTPRLVINGNVISSSTNYSDANLFSSYSNLTSPFEIKLRQFKHNADSILCHVVIKAVASHSLTEALLFAALAEDTVFYQGSNGEPQHHNVLRKTLTSANGATINLPSQVGDSVVFNYKSIPLSFWNIQRMYTMAIIQDISTKQLIQAEALRSKENSAPTSIHELNNNAQFSVFPNPSNSSFTIKTSEEMDELIVVNNLGVIIANEKMSGKQTTLDFSQKPSGVYHLRILRKNVPVHTERVIVIR